MHNTKKAVGRHELDDCRCMSVFGFVIHLHGFVFVIHPHGWRQQKLVLVALTLLPLVQNIGYCLEWYCLEANIHQLYLPVAYICTLPTARG